MKLVAAKCPSCGANIKIDRELKFTKCDYCNSQISVEEAVENLIKVELKDNPTLDNYLLLGERYYNNKEFEEAYKAYSKAEEIEPNNPLVVLRKGLCKSMLSTYNNFEVSSAINGLKNALSLMKKMSFSKDDIYQSIDETGFVISASKYFLNDIYQNNKLTKSQIAGFVEKMEECLNGFIYLDSLVDNNKDLEIKIWDSIIDTIDYLLGDGKYNLSSSYVSELTKIRTEYITKREKKYGPYTRKGNKKTIEKVVAVEGKTSKFKDILCYGMIGFLVLLFLGSIFTNEPILTILIWLLAIISFIPQIKKVLVKKYGANIGKIVVIARVVIVIAAVVIMASGPSVFENTYKGEGDFKITISGGSVTIHDGDIITTGEYSWDSKGDDYFIHVSCDNGEKLEYKYHPTNDGGVLCLLSNNQCDTTYLPVN